MEVSDQLHAAPRGIASWKFIPKPAVSPACSCAWKLTEPGAALHTAAPDMLAFDSFLGRINPRPLQLLAALHRSACAQVPLQASATNLNSSRQCSAQSHPVCSHKQHVGRSPGIAPCACPEIEQYQESLSTMRYLLPFRPASSSLLARRRGRLRPGRTFATFAAAGETWHDQQCQSPLRCWIAQLLRSRSATTLPVPSLHHVAALVCLKPTDLQHAFRRRRCAAF